MDQLDPPHEAGRAPQPQDRPADPSTSSGPDDTVRRSERRGRKPPPTVHVELVLVGGAEGRQLRQQQAAAMRAALRWLADNRTTEDSG